MSASKATTPGRGGGVVIAQDLKSCSFGIVSSNLAHVGVFFVVAAAGVDDVSMG